MRSLPKSLLSILIIFQSNILQAQEKYTILSTSIGYLYNHKVQGNLSETFPYSSKDIYTGVVTRSIFTGGLQNPFSTNIYLIDLFQAEGVKHHHSFIFGVGINNDVNMNYSAYFKGGYAHIFPIHFLQRNARDYINFKTSLELLYMWGYDETLGTIDNNNKIVDLLGQQASNQYTIARTRYSAGGTYNADHIAVFYQRTHLMLCPKISFTNKPPGHLYWAMETGWFIPLIQTDTLKPYQMSSDSSASGNVVASVGINDQGASTTLNNTTLIRSPSLGGLYLGIKIGCFVVNKPKAKHKDLACL